MRTLNIPVIVFMLNNTKDIMEAKTVLPKRIWIVTAILAAVVIAAVVAGVAYSRSDAVRFRRQIDLGNKYLEELNYEQAIAEFTRALEIMPDDENALSALVSAYIDWGSSLLESQDYEKAIKVLTEAYGRFPENSEIYEKLVQEYLNWIDMCIELGNLEDALTIAEQAYELTDDEQFMSLYDEIQISIQNEKINEERTAQLSPFMNLESMLHDGSGKRTVIGSSYPGYYRTYSERKEAYDPVIGMLEEYIMSLENHPIPELMERVHWQGERINRVTDPVYVSPISGCEFPMIADALYLLQRFYLQCGDLENTYRVRESMINYFLIDDSTDLLGEHTDNAGYIYDGYGRAIYVPVTGGNITGYAYKYIQPYDLSEENEDSGGYAYRSEYEDGRIVSREGYEWGRQLFRTQYTYDEDKVYIEYIDIEDAQYNKSYDILIDKYGFDKTP